MEIVPAAVVEMVPAAVVEMVPVEVVEIVPTDVVEIVPADVVDIVPVLARAVADRVSVNTNAEAAILSFVIVFLLVSQASGVVVGSGAFCLAAIVLKSTIPNIVYAFTLFNRRAMTERTPDEHLNLNDISGLCA